MTLRLLRTVLVAMLVVGCASGPVSSTGAPSPEPTRPATASPDAPAAPSGVAAERAADLAYLVEQLEAIHPNPYLDEGETAFQARVDAIRTEAGSMTDAGFLVAVMDLMGHRDRDGHSGAWAMAQTGERLHAWPIWLWDFPDGLRVVASRDDPGVIGARLMRVGATAVEEARAAVEPLVPRDNPSSLRANLPMYLTLPEVLDELGLRAPGGPGLTLELLDGSTRELAADPLPIPAFHDWIAGVYRGDYPTGLPPDDDGPPHLQRRDEAFWSTKLADAGALYVGYNFVARATDAGRSIGDLAHEITDEAPTDPTQPFVIDLRNNPGGDNTTYRQLRDAVETMARERPDRVSIIAGRSTFSAAGNFITDLLTGSQAGDIRLIGEAPGGGLNIYGDVRVVTLPSSGIVVLISRRYHERAPGDDRLAIEPDRPVEISWADYAAGRDPVLEAAVRP
jgi:hypothetical protein